MREKDLISIIVPVYNVEKYLDRCMKSILCQTYKNIEVILVDDGSTDASAVMCDQYQLEDNRIRVFHKPNGGLSSARNYGIEKSKGKFILFVDSDDYIGTDFIEILYSEMIHQDASMVIGSTEVMYKDDSIYTSCINGVHKIYTPKEALKVMCLNTEFGVSACGKLYKIGLFDTSRFPDGELYEDLQTIPYLLEECEKVVYCSEARYYWYQRIGSIMHSFNKENLIWFDAAEAFVDYVDEKYPDLHDYAICRYINDSFWSVVQRMALTDDSYENLCYAKRRCQKYWKYGIKNKYLSKRKKINLCLILLSPRIYQFVYKNYWRYFKKNKV